MCLMRDLPAGAIYVFDWLSHRCRFFSFSEFQINSIKVNVFGHCLSKIRSMDRINTATMYVWHSLYKYIWTAMYVVCTLYHKMFIYFYYNSCNAIVVRQFRRLSEMWHWNLSHLIWPQRSICTRLLQSPVGFYFILCSIRQDNTKSIFERKLCPWISLFAEPRNRIEVDVSLSQQQFTWKRIKNCELNCIHIAVYRAQCTLCGNECSLYRISLSLFDR